MVSISISSVSKRFGSLKALDDVSLDIDEPMVMGILGPNGAGKTTLLKLITGIMRPSSGKILINGRSVANDPKNVLKDVGSLIEQPEFCPYLTGYESLRFVCRIRGMDSSDCEDEIRRVAEMTSIKGYLHRRTGNYSRGMKQRLGIAAAMACDPEILVLDEPTTGLDPKGMKEIRDIISKISREERHIVILSTHLLNEARDVCDRVTIINGGKLAYDSRAVRRSDIITVRVSKVPENMVINSPFVQEYRTEGGRLIIRKSTGTENHSVVKYLVESGWNVDGVASYDDLEDKYIGIVGKGGE